MRAVYTALRNRFHANPTLKLKGRDLLLGLTEKEAVTVTRPYTELNYRSDGSEDTFDADVDRWACEFYYHAKDLKGTAATDWQEAMRTAFRDGNITSPEFSCCGTQNFEVDGPSESDGSYDAKCSFILITQRFVRNPVTAGT